MAAARLPPLNALIAFDAAARCESFSRAAEEIHVTHGAVSHQVKSLEDFLGVRLFLRTGRRVLLTAHGKVFAERIRAALHEIDAAARSVSQQHRANRLTITTMPSFAARWLVPRLGRFMEAHLDLEVNLHTSIELVDLARAEIDVAIRFGRGDWEGVEVELFMQDEYFPVCSPKFNRGNLPQRPEDLARARLLRSQDEPWTPWLRAAGVHIAEPRASEFSDAALMLQAAVAGQGIALSRRSLADSDLAAGTLTRLFDIAVATQSSYYLVWPKHLTDAPKILAFRDWLAAEKRAYERQSRSVRQKRKAHAR